MALSEQEKFAKLSIVLVVFELQKIIDRLPPLSSPEEGVQFIRQKVDELSHAISSFDDKAMLQAAKGIAAASMRFMIEICLKKTKHGNEPSGPRDST